MESEKSNKGTRPVYTPEQKQEVLDFIRNYNKENKRGGQTAAVKHFGISSVTINNWVKKERTASQRRVRKETPAVVRRRQPSIDPVEGFRKLADVHEQIKLIEAQMDQLNALKAEAEELCRQLGI